MRHRQATLTAVFSITALLSIFAGASAFTAYAYTNEVLPRVYLAGEHIGNLSFQEASQKIGTKITELESTKLPISVGDQQASVTPTDLGITINETEIQKQLLVVNDPWSWARPSFWRHFFTKTDVAVVYDFDRATVLQKVEEVLAIDSSARDANLAFSNGSLVVNSGQNGISIDIDVVHQSLNSFFTSGVTEPIELSYVETQPSITDEVVAATKQQVENTFTTPIAMQFEDKTFTIPPQDQHSLLSFNQQAGQLAWSADTTKVQDYLFQHVARTLNISMKQRVIMQETGEVTNQGQDGREVNLSGLTTSIVAAINNKEVVTQPILISAKSIPLTEKIITPGYIAGLFEGLYLDVNLTRQRIYVMIGTQRQTEWLVSSGKRGTPTPVGQFYIKNKLELAQSRLFPGIWMQKWNALAKNPDGSGYEGYGLHRVPCFNSSCTITENYSHLGRPASHGCVRIEDAGADWIYDNIPVGTPVNIHL